MAQAAAGQAGLVRAEKYGWLIAGLVALAIFGWLHSVPTFPDPDAYYHGVLAQAAWDGQVPTALPQAWFTELRVHFTDQHLLYHVLLSPFVALLGLATGLKVASALLGAAAVAVFYAVARALGVRHAWLPTTLLLLTQSWMYRLGLVKVTPLSLIIVLVGILLALRRRPLALGALACVYVYVYVGFMLLPLIVTAMLFVDWLAEKFLKSENGKQRTKRWVVVIATWLGAAIGLVVNPYFPGNIYQFFVQFISIGVVNQGGIGVANEWLPATAKWLLQYAAVPIVALACGVAAAIVQPRRKFVAALAAVALCTFIFTVRARRYVEYFAPLALLAAAAAIDFPSAARVWLKSLSRRALVGGASTAALAVVVFGAVELRQVHGTLDELFPSSGLGQSCEWLKKNIAPGAMVFNVNWGEWPLLYSCTTELRYVAGLDMRFMYRQYPELALRYQRIARGQLSGPELTRTISQDFGSQYVVVTENNKDTAAALAEAPGMAEVYHDPRVQIFQVTAPQVWK